MSLQNLVNVAKCPECPNMVPVGRIRPDKPRRCDQCKNKLQRIKERAKARDYYRAKHPKKCFRCGSDISFTNGIRKEVCLDCQKIIRDQYNNRTCIYCNTPLKGFTNKFCNNNCRNKTLYIVNGRKKYGL